MQHVKRAGANSSGARPVWELLEGHAFFKEKWIDFDVSSQKGRKLGPVVFPTVKVQQPPWSVKFGVLQAQLSIVYLPP
jgi:hypothetical protein